MPVVAPHQPTTRETQTALPLRRETQPEPLIGNTRHDSSVATGSAGSGAVTKPGTSPSPDHSTVDPGGKHARASRLTRSRIAASIRGAGFETRGSSVAIPARLTTHREDGGAKSAEANPRWAPAAWRANPTRIGNAVVAPIPEPTRNFITNYPRVIDSLTIPV